MNNIDKRRLGMRLITEREECHRFGQFGCFSKEKDKNALDKGEV
jgi:hypothetical protein